MTTPSVETALQFRAEWQEALRQHNRTPDPQAPPYSPHLTQGAWEAYQAALSAILTKLGVEAGLPRADVERLLQEGTAYRYRTGT